MIRYDVSTNPRFSWLLAESQSVKDKQLSTSTKENEIDCFAPSSCSLEQGTRTRTVATKKYSWHASTGT